MLTLVLTDGKGFSVRAPERIPYKRPEKQGVRNCMVNWPLGTDIYFDPSRNPSNRPRFFPLPTPIGIRNEVC